MVTREQEEQLREFVAQLDEQQRAALKDRALVALAQEDTPDGFAAFFRLMHGTPLHSEGRRWIINAYEAHGKNQGLAQECHREAGKTTVFSKFFMAFRIGQEPHKVSAIIRISDDKAKETASAVAHLIMHDPRWKLCFPHVIPDETRSWGADSGFYVRDKNLSDEEWARKCEGRPDGPTLVGRGWGSGAIIGSRYNGLLIVDDIHNEENTSSARQLNAVKQFYTDTLKFCVMRGAWEVWNFTPWTETDTYAFIKNTGEYMVSKTPVMTPASEGSGTYWPPMPLNPQFPEAGNIPLSGRWWHLYWPENWDFERIASKYRTTTPMGFARMMLLDLEATKGLNLKAEWLHEYPAADIKASWPVIMGVDYASTADKVKNRGRDFFAMAILRAIPGGGLVLVDGYRAHVSKGEALDAVMSYWSLYPTLHKIGVESIGKGEEFYNDLALLQDSNGRIPPLVEITHGRTSKGDRFENWLAPRFSQARIWIADTFTPFLDAFREEWLNFPNAANDDTLDAVYMAAFAGEGFLPSFHERSGKSSFSNAPYRPNPMASAFGRSVHL